MPGIIPCRVHAPDVEHGIGRVHVQDRVPFRRPKKIRQAAEAEQSPPWQEVLVGGVPRVSQDPLHFRVCCLGSRVLGFRV